MPFPSYNFVPSAIPPSNGSDGQRLFPSINVVPAHQPLDTLFTYTHAQDNSANTLVCPDVHAHYGRQRHSKPDMSGSSSSDSSGRKRGRDSTRKPPSASHRHNISRITLDPVSPTTLTHISVSVPHRKLGPLALRFPVLDVGVSSPVYKVQLPSHSPTHAPLTFHISRTGAAVGLAGARNPNERWVINQVISDPSNRDVPSHRIAVAEIYVRNRYIQRMVEWVMSGSAQYPHKNGIDEPLASLDVFKPKQIPTLIKTDGQPKPHTAHLWNAMGPDGDVIMEAVLVSVVLAILDGEMREMSSAGGSPPLPAAPLTSPYRWQGSLKRAAQNIQQPVPVPLPAPLPAPLPSSTSSPSASTKRRRWSFGTSSWSKGSSARRLTIPAPLARSPTIPPHSVRSARSPTTPAPLSRSTPVMSDMASRPWERIEPRQRSLSQSRVSDPTLGSKFSIRSPINRKLFSRSSSQTRVDQIQRSFSAGNHSYKADKVLPMPPTQIPYDDPDGYDSDMPRIPRRVVSDADADTLQYQLPSETSWYSDPKRYVVVSDEYPDHTPVMEAVSPQKYGTSPSRQALSPEAAFPHYGVSPPRHATSPITPVLGAASSQNYTLSPPRQFTSPQDHSKSPPPRQTPPSRGYTQPAPSANYAPPLRQQASRQSAQPSRRVSQNGMVSALEQLALRDASSIDKAMPPMLQHYLYADHNEDSWSRVPSRQPSAAGRGGRGGSREREIPKMPGSYGYYEAPSKYSPKRNEPAYKSPPSKQSNRSSRRRLSFGSSPQEEYRSFTSTAGPPPPPPPMIM